MSSTEFFSSASEFVKTVVSDLEATIGLRISSHYKRENNAPNDVEITYRCGESEAQDAISADGRKRHDIELFFNIFINTAKDGFDEEALDLATRIEREFLANTWGAHREVDLPTYVRSDPVMFERDKGYFQRTVTIRQCISVGPIEDCWLELDEADGYVDGADKPDIVIRADGTASAAGH